MTDLEVEIQLSNMIPIGGYISINFGSYFDFDFGEEFRYIDQTTEC